MALKVFRKVTKIHKKGHFMMGIYVPFDLWRHDQRSYLIVTFEFRTWEHNETLQRREKIEQFGDIVATIKR